MSARDEIKKLIDDLSDARADGTIYTYGQVQHRLVDILELVKDFDS